jgi:hypothetical protein
MEEESVVIIHDETIYVMLKTLSFMEDYTKYQIEA